MITSPHFHVRKIVIVIMLTACLPESIRCCHAIEDASDNAISASASPAKRFVCPIKCPKIKCPEFSWPRFSCSHKIRTDTSDENVDFVAPAFALTDKPQILQVTTCDNSPEAITLKPSGSKTEEIEYGDIGTSLNFTGKSKSFEKLQSDVIDSSIEHKEGSFYSSAPAPLRLKVRQMYEKVYITLPEDNLGYKSKNEAFFGILPKRNYEIDYPVTGSDAWRTITKSGFHYDCVITDLQMGNRSSWALDMYQYAISYATKHKAQYGIDLSDIAEMPEGIILAAALREIEYTGPIIAVTSDFQQVNTEGDPLYKYRHLFQEARFKIQKRENINALLKKHGVRSRQSIRMPNIFSSFSSSKPQKTES